MNNGSFAAQQPLPQSWPPYCTIGSKVKSSRGITVCLPCYLCVFLIERCCRETPKKHRCHTGAHNVNIVERHHTELTHPEHIMTNNKPQEHLHPAFNHLVANHQLGHCTAVGADVNPILHPEAAALTFGIVAGIYRTVDTGTNFQCSQPALRAAQQ
jgi:hypothetical protein